MQDKRIQGLIKAAEDLKKGCFHLDLPVEGGDELSQLTAAVIELGRVMERRFMEAQKISEITEEINKGLVLDEVLNYTYENFRSIIPYDRIGFSSIDPDGKIVRAYWARSDTLGVKLDKGYWAFLEGSSLKEIIKTGKPRIINDLEEYQKNHPNSESTKRILADGVRSNLTCPLIAAGKPTGFIFFSSREKNTYKDIHLDLFLQIASQFSVIVEKSQLYNKLALEKIKLEEVLKIEEGLNGIINLDQLVDFIVNQTRKVLEAGRCSLILVDDHTRALCIRGHSGFEQPFIENNRLKAGNSIAEIVAATGDPILVTDIEEDERFARKNKDSYKSKSFLIAPVKLGYALMGVISVADKNSMDGNVFSGLDLKILNMISRQAAVAIENAKLYGELKHLTVTDPMTNIYNYRHFAISFENELKRLKRYPGSLCLMMIDADDFKSYNDTFGHLEGDNLLKGIAGVLKESLRESDISCRYGGDEFVVILPETTVLQARIVAKKINEKIARLPLKRKQTVSIGIAQCAEAMGRHDLILKADTALYTAKKEGKGRVCAL